MMPEKKQIHLKDLTVDEAGRVKAVFATLGVIDHDRDIVMPGATENGTKVRISAYGHASWGGALPVGKGIISEVGNELVFDGQFFLDTSAGADTYKTMKALGELAEWSYGFDILEKDFASDPETGQEIRRIKKQKIYEVSPVLLGAGIATRTLDIKSLGAESQTYQEHAETLLAGVGEFVKRSQSIADLRAEKGKEPAAQKNRDGLKAIASELQKAAGELNRIALSDPEAEELKVRADVAALFGQIEANEVARSIA
jgi:HK97 family phage prohead protease